MRETQNLIAVPGAKIATYAIGEGAPVIFLHGGPGDTHHYMKRMAKPLFEKHRCIFFDQRGTGLSVVERRAADQFTLDHMLSDLAAVHKFYSAAPVGLVGHSWGAMYGLLACLKFPEKFTAAALLNMGPLDAEAEKRTSENLLKELSPEEAGQWEKIRQRRSLARDTGDFESVIEADKELMSLRVKSWIFDPKLHDVFLADYFLDPPPDREVNKWVWEAQVGSFNWDRLKIATSKIWLCAGDHDATPVSQTERLARALPNASVSIYKKCGHIPWMEQPERFYADLERCLAERVP